MTAPLLDTHVWVWYMIGDKRLDQNAVAALDKLPADNRPCIAAISLWEVAMLSMKNRLQLQTDIGSWLNRAANIAAVRILPITSPIVAEMSRLPENFHHDPADRLIVSTARVLNLPLASEDRLICDSGLVTLANFK